MISANNLSDLLKGLSIPDLFESFEPFNTFNKEYSQQHLDRDECDISKESLNERIQKELEKMNKQKQDNDFSENYSRNIKKEINENIKNIEPKKIKIEPKPIKIFKKSNNNLDKIKQKINESETNLNNFKQSLDNEIQNENLIKRESIKCEIDRCKNYHNELMKKIDVLKSEDNELNKRIKELENEYSLIKIDILEEIKQKYIKKYSSHNLMYFEDFEELYNELKKNKDLNIEIIEAQASLSNLRHPQDDEALTRASTISDGKTDENELNSKNKYSILVEGGGIDDDTILQIRIMKRMFNKIVKGL